MSAMAAVNKSERPFLPAAGRDRFLPLYDVITKLLGADKARQAFLNQGILLPGERVLDIGCGTGTLVVMLKENYPGVEVVGLDPDPRALDRARRKASKRDVSVQFDQGFADTLPYGDRSFDAVFSSFMFHHLEADVKEGTLREVRRILKPAGRLHLMDFEVQTSTSLHSPMRLFHTHKRLKDNNEKRIIDLITQAGLIRARRVGLRPVMFGLAQVGFYEALAP